MFLSCGLWFTYNLTPQRFKSWSQQADQICYPTAVNIKKCCTCSFAVMCMKENGCCNGDGHVIVFKAWKQMVTCAPAVMNLKCGLQKLTYHQNYSYKACYWITRFFISIIILYHISIYISWNVSMLLNIFLKNCCTWECLSYKQWYIRLGLSIEIQFCSYKSMSALSDVDLLSKFLLVGGLVCAFSHLLPLIYSQYIGQAGMCWCMLQGNVGKINIRPIKHFDKTWNLKLSSVTLHLTSQHITSRLLRIKFFDFLMLGFWQVYGSCHTGWHCL